MIKRDNNTIPGFYDLLFLTKFPEMSFKGFTTAQLCTLNFKFCLFLILYGLVID